jgi:hypothetical protein
VVYTFSQYLEEDLTTGQPLKDLDRALSCTEKVRTLLDVRLAVIPAIVPPAVRVLPPLFAHGCWGELPRVRSVTAELLADGVPALEFDLF